MAGKYYQKSRTVGSYLCYWRHGELQRWAWHAVGKVHLILLCEALILGVRRPAVLCDERIHGDVDCGLCF